MIKLINRIKKLFFKQKPGKYWYPDSGKPKGSNCPAWLYEKKVSLVNKHNNEIKILDSWYKHHKECNGYNDLIRIGYTFLKDKDIDTLKLLHTKRNEQT